ncbi:MAG TPA: efflux RND transporter periplasmic adaptor subunit [Vicinamibacterales bacterium]|nr:efflux RND transporter periplasmic adaptor subunit [Vicinamibacterales bacterium]
MTDLKDDLAALRIDRAPERPRRRWVSWAVLLLLLAGVGAGLYGWLTRERPLAVQVATVVERAAGAQAAVLNAAGYVTARRRATVSSKITGKVIEVNVEEGMRVRAGQILARLDDSVLRASLGLVRSQVEATRGAVTEAEVRLREARLTLERRRTLLAERVVTQADVDAAQAEVDSLDARIVALGQQVDVASQQVAVTEANLADTIIRAPFSGIAISKDAQPGEMVSPVSAGGGFTRTGICTIVDMTSLEIEVDVSESYINRVRDRQPVTAILDAYPDWPIPARVITTIPAADRQKATVLVRIGFVALDPRILPDMGVKVTFHREADETDAPAARPTALVPKVALRDEGGTSVVFVLRPDGTVERRAVQTGGADGDRIEILAGLTAGERVVVSPPEALVNGTRVVVQ